MTQASSPDSHTATCEYKRAVDLADCVVIGVDDDRRVVLCNEPARRLFGRELLGTRIDAAALGELAQSGETFFAGLEDKRNGAAATFASTVATDAGPRDFLWTWTPSQTQESAVAAFLFGHDAVQDNAAVTRAHRTDLAHRMSALGAALAHEIRNPVNGALLHLLVLRRSLEKSEMKREWREATEVIADQLQRLSVLVTDFLEYAQPEATSFEKISTRDVAHASMGTAEKARNGHNVELDAQVDDIALTGDAKKIEQALTHLLSNAIEACGGEGRVQLRGIANHAWFSFVVEDTGPGIPAKIRPFEPFASSKTSGTGLGLAIVARTAEEHRGSIHYRRVENITQFELKLPIPTRGDAR